MVERNQRAKTRTSIDISCQHVKTLVSERGQPEPAENVNILASRCKGPRLAVIDQRALTRQGLARVVDSASTFCVLTFSNVSELLSNSRETVSEIAMILINLGSTVVSDNSVRREIDILMRAIPEAPIVLLSDHDDSRFVGEALRQGIRGYIPTTATSRILVEALRFVQCGGIFVPASALLEVMSQRHMGARGSMVQLEQLDLSPLTPRQRAVFDLLRQGKPNKIIAYELGMGESTVKVHVRHIMRKLQANNRTHLASLASRCGVADER